MKVKLSPISGQRQILTSSSNNVINQSQISRHILVQIRRYPYKSDGKTFKLVVKKPLIYSSNVLLNSADEINLLQKEMDRDLIKQLKLLLLTI